MSRGARVAVVGAGGWGTALAGVLAKSGNTVLLWAREPEVVEDIAKNRRNAIFLPGIELPEGIEATSDLSRVGGHEFVVMATPSHVLREISKALAPSHRAGTVLVSVTKGFELNTGMTPSRILKENLDATGDHVCVLSGPSHAEEVARDIPTAVVVAGTPAAAVAGGPVARACDLFFTPRFRVYSCADILGVEVGGALKNVIAIACGIADGLGFGDNTQAALITRGLTEITRLGCALGARRETFGGLAGVGDLVVTCTSRHSRNRQLGNRIGGGETLEEILKTVSTVAEGVHASRGAVGLARKAGVAMPITEEVHSVLNERKPASAALKDLLSREARSEEEDLPLP